ncbi:MAG TPA: NAD(+) diphosphatase [Hyphomicrobiaceae bacterium]|nr:NAD(+) diphosphatase [Hyphomicrobiaceae bacterium]
MPTVATTTLLDRMGPKRSDKDWLAGQRSSSAARFMVFTDLKPVINGSADRSSASIRWLSTSEIADLGLQTEDAMFLGLSRDAAVPHFAIAMTEHFARTVRGGVEHLRPAVDLRSLAMQGLLTPEEQSLAGQARALAQWHENARCCGRCGSQTRVKDGGWRRKCWSCGTDWFPRTDPVVIMLVTDGTRCLLAHEHRYQNSMWSTLAGFLEPGEDIEHAVRREVHEETGIRVGKVAYHSSQPWPFPHSLMMGCIGFAETTELKIDKSELADARWFSLDEVRSMAERRHPEGLTVPGKHAIASILIRSFLEGKVEAMRSTAR